MIGGDIPPLFCPRSFMCKLIGWGKVKHSLDYKLNLRSIQKSKSGRTGTIMAEFGISLGISGPPAEWKPWAKVG
jgi:hypothetical protein